MPIVPNPIPFTAPDLPGSDRTKLGQLWIVVERCAQILRAFAAGTLMEWHEDEHLTTTVALIPHRLGRRPRFAFMSANDTGRVPIFSKEQSTDERVALSVGAGTAKVSFLLL